MKIIPSCTHKKDWYLNRATINVTTLLSHNAGISFYVWEIRISYETDHFLGQTAHHQSRFCNGRLPRVSSAVTVWGPHTFIFERIWQWFSTRDLYFREQSLQSYNLKIQHAQFCKKDIPLHACLLTYSYKISMQSNCALARYNCSGNYI